MKPQVPSAGRKQDLAALTRLGEAFGEPTRVRVYGLLSSAAEPCSAGDLAQALGLHRTVVRAHLERMVELGFLVSGVRHTGRGGRPAKVYAVAPDTALPEHRHRWLAEAVLDLVGRLVAEGQVHASSATVSLESAGKTCGMVLRESLTLAVHAEGGRAVRGESEAMSAAIRLAAIRWLAAAGYQPRPGAAGASELSLHACAFPDLHDSHGPLVCAFDQGLLRGLFETGDAELALTPGDGDEACRLEPALAHSVLPAAEVAVHA
jgi:predicted ArsR family transcriptional regulator